MSFRTFDFHLSNIAVVPKTYGVYVLKHDKTNGMFFGSTVDLNERLRLWFYAITRINYKARLPPKVKILRDSGSFHPIDWSFWHEPRTRPADFVPRAKLQYRPEYHMALEQFQLDPNSVLNDMRSLKGRVGRKAGALTVHQRGLSPYAYLGRLIGTVTPKLYPNIDIVHRWAWSLQRLDPLGAPQVAFPLYLWRSMANALNKKSTNPTPECMTAVYDDWLQHVPNDYVRTLERIESVFDALAVPLPKGYEPLRLTVGWDVVMKHISEHMSARNTSCVTTT